MTDDFKRFPNVEAMKEAYRKDKLFHPDPPTHCAISLNFAQTAFEQFPNNETAGVYLRVLMEYEADDMIDDDTFLDGLASIAVYLLPREGE